MTERPVLVFDIGGVLLDFSFRHLFGDRFDSPDELEHFLKHILTWERWIETDSGKRIGQMVEEINAVHSGYEDHLEQLVSNWMGVIRGPIPGMFSLLEKLMEDHAPIYAITNFSAETFPLAAQAYPLLNRFEDTVISGVEGVQKPDPRIYQIFLERNGLDARSCLFIDDRPENIDAAQKLGMQGHCFQSYEILNDALRSLNFDLPK